MGPGVDVSTLGALQALWDALGSEYDTVGRSGGVLHPLGEMSIFATFSDPLTEATFSGATSVISRLEMHRASRFYHGALWWLRA